MKRITAENVKANIEWARGKCEAHGDRQEVQLAEHVDGTSYSADGRYTLTSDAFHKERRVTGNFDYDMRCDCCGVISALGSQDITEGQEDAAYARIVERLSKHKPLCNC